MSSLLYGPLTRKREEANAGKSKDDEPPGVGTYADALAALIPAEVLALHAVIIGRGTKSVNGVTTITAPDQLVFWFWFLVVMSSVLYIVGLRKVPRGWDIVRVFIPPLSFLAWTMLQPTTVFDALAASAYPDWRWTIGLALAVVLGGAASLLGVKADADPPKPNDQAKPEDPAKPKEKTGTA